MYKIGLSTCGAKPMDEKGLLEMKSAGIDAIEVCRGDYKELDFAALRRAADSAEIDLWSIHSHMHRSFDISSTDKESNQRAIKEFTWLIDRISDVGIDKVVIHPTHTPEPFDQSERDEKIKHAMECLDYLAEYGHQKNVMIALENLPRTCLANTVDEHLKMLSVNDKLKVCFDFNHSLIDDTVQVIEKLGNKIITVHVSDRDNINERHWLPGEGVLEWNGVMDAFLKTGYNGAWIYEIDLAAPPTIERRTLTYADFVENAKALFERKTPPILGKPLPNLGLWGPKE